MHDKAEHPCDDDKHLRTAHLIRMQRQTGGLLLRRQQKHNIGSQAETAAHIKRRSESLLMLYPQVVDRTYGIRFRAAWSGVASSTYGGSENAFIFEAPYMGFA